jgi:glycosyltransferase involved in cell wall biosynthesis
MGVAGAVKKQIRRHIGLWPALEMKNRVAAATKTPGLSFFEDAEVARLKKEIGYTPAARIACIVPTFKRSKGLVSAVNSILRQTRQDFVIIIVDDGGGLPALPADPRIHAVSLSRNTKVLGLVRNVGARLTSSRYIAFLDDDNSWEPNHLDVAVAALEGDADLIYTSIRRRRPDGSDLDILSGDFDRRKFSDASCWVDANAIALKREAFKPFSRIPRTKKTFPKEDWEFVWRVSGNSKVVHIPTVTVNYLVNPESYFTAWKAGAV